MKKILLFAALGIALQATAQAKKSDVQFKKKTTNVEHKKVVYQVFTRLFGNTNTTNKPWGTKEENGVGKFNDFTDKALQEIKDLGVTHIWFTGVPHHALVADYTKYGISNDDPDVVKGRAGSPYAVKDYYNVNPDLAVNPANRLAEFQALIDRAHKHGLKVIIDIVPNHIARKYVSTSKPDYVKDFGTDDDVTQEYNRNNNFYYIPGQAFEVPTSPDYKPLNGEAHPMIDGKFDENPAKWTGNGSRLAKPDINDWYETVKVNYGIRPDGTKDFAELPEGFEKKSYAEHYDFWKTQDVPNSWWKFREIAEYWLAKGVDGFRYDMAEMVPYEFWSFMNSAIKMKNPKAFLLAEVYNPNEYRNYIHKGKMDYLYDKVETYDHLKAVIQGRTTTDGLTDIRQRNKDIEHHMLHFLDNHDEQRLASPEFAGSGERGKPLMVVSTTLSTAPTMVYFGQEVGEPGNEDAGFGKRSRTSIFDYIGVPNHQRWMNQGKFDGGQLTEKEKALRDFYKRLLNFSIKSSALMGNYLDLHAVNAQTTGYDGQQYAFARWSDTEKLIVVSNFDSEHAHQYKLKISNELINLWHLKDGSYPVKDVLFGKTFTLQVKQGLGFIDLQLAGSESFILKL
ncbi:alpha-amylase family protein [Flavobacterium stagni]|uniref:Alpha-amylase n=1 Tax=Flavobacterium stagni TaxID=2506421 RepID=A0A4Q1KBD0_9FLAO|nr:alpha-amylase family protein [Flavobacterium stagni]RXR23503.1 alpha-amylase [Flavobacterium stagni]